MIGAHEMTVLRAVADGKYTGNSSMGNIGVPNVKAAFDRLVRAGLVSRAFGPVRLTDRGKAALNPPQVAPMAAYVPPPARPVRDGAMRWAALPSVYASAP